MTPVLLTLAMLSSSAHAGQAMDPQVRLHAGMTWTGGPSPFGVTGGIDARLTRIVAIDLGGFLSPVEIPEGDWVADPVDGESFHLRHALFFAPGLRIPHAQPRTWAWDVFVRGGPAVAWYADTSQESYSLDGDPYAVSPGIAGFGGGELMVRFGAVGARVAGRAWFYEAMHTSVSDPAFKVEPQVAVEALVQF